MEITRQRRSSLSMDMTPMIDCVFQLLIFFMLSSTFLTPSLELTLPKAASDELPEQEEVIVSLDAEGKVFVNQTEVQITGLREALEPVVAKSKKKIVTIRGDEGMRYEWFVKALAAAEASGAAHVNVAHESAAP